MPRMGPFKDALRDLDNKGFFAAAEKPPEVNFVLVPDKPPVANASGPNTDGALRTSGRNHQLENVKQLLYQSIEVINGLSMAESLTLFQQQSTDEGQAFEPVVLDSFEVSGPNSTFGSASGWNAELELPDPDIGPVESDIADDWSPIDASKESELVLDFPDEENQGVQAENQVEFESDTADESRTVIEPLEAVSSLITEAEYGSNKEPDESLSLTHEDDAPQALQDDAPLALEDDTPLALEDWDSVDGNLKDEEGDQEYLLLDEEQRDEAEVEITIGDESSVEDDSHLNDEAILGDDEESEFELHIETEKEEVADAEYGLEVVVGAEVEYEPEVEISIHEDDADGVVEDNSTLEVPLEVTSETECEFEQIAAEVDESPVASASAEVEPEADTDAHEGIEPEALDSTERGLFAAEIELVDNELFEEEPAVSTVEQDTPEYEHEHEVQHEHEVEAEVVVAPDAGHEPSAELDPELKFPSPTATMQIGNDAFERLRADSEAVDEAESESHEGYAMDSSDTEEELPEPIELNDVIQRPEPPAESRTPTMILDHNGENDQPELSSPDSEHRSEPDSEHPSEAGPSIPDDAVPNAEREPTTEQFMQDGIELPDGTLLIPSAGTAGGVSIAQHLGIRPLTNDTASAGEASADIPDYGINLVPKQSEPGLDSSAAPASADSLISQLVSDEANAEERSGGPSKEAVAALLQQVLGTSPQPSDAHDGEDVPSGLAQDTAQPQPGEPSQGTNSSESSPHYKPVLETWATLTADAPDASASGAIESESDGPPPIELDTMGTPESIGPVHAAAEVTAPTSVSPPTAYETQIAKRLLDTDFGVKIKRLGQSILQQTKSGSSVVVLLVSADVNPHRSDLVAGLGMYLYAQQTRPTIIVDADLENATLTRGFAAQGAGLVESVAGQAMWSQCVRPTACQNLNLLPCAANSGAVLPDGQECSDRVAAMVGEWRSTHGLTIIDGGTISSPIAPALSGAADSTLICVELGKSNRDTLVESCQSLVNAGANIAGCISTGE